MTMPDDGRAASRPVSEEATGDPIWDDWEAPPRLPAVPVLHLDGFDGPIDVLLDLAERQLVDLGRISILTLVDQFLEAMGRVATKVAIERRAEWIIIATRLVLLRSKLLFPENPEAAAEAERAAATEIARLDALRFIRAAAGWLQDRPQRGQDVFTRRNSEQNPRVASYVALMEACLTVLQSGAGEEAGDETAVYRPLLSDLFNVRHAIARIRTRLAERHGTELLTAFVPPLPSSAKDRILLARSAISSTFMAALELTRGGELTLAQNGLFQPIAVTRDRLKPGGSMGRADGRSGEWDEVARHGGVDRGRRHRLHA
jgi:segregation and condensation protein A